MQHDQQHAAPLPEINGYRLLRVIAEGSSSVVYLARQESLGRQVAVKVMRPEALADEVGRRRFENEARTIGRLEHPHIVGIFQIGCTADGRPFYAMPYMAGGSLRERDLRGSEEAIRNLLSALLRALSYAHARGVIHRDVKAENVLFDEAGRPLLADFGIALRRGYGSRVTSAGLAVGSTAYMPPEQARGEEVDPRADLYSVGVLAWELLTGRLPFEAADALSMAVMHAQNPVPRLPPELRHWQRFLDRALAKYPLKRYHDADDMLRALERVPAPGTRRLSALPALVARLPGYLRRVPRTAWVAAVVVLAAGIGLGLPTSRNGPDRGFFRARALDQPTGQRARATAPATAEHPDHALLRAAPESAAGKLITRARQQIEARRLTQPAGDNAYESLAAAAEADPEHLELPAAAAALLKALAAEASRHSANGDIAAAAELLHHGERAARLSPGTQREQLAAMRMAVAESITARVAHAEAQFDRDAALASAAVAARAGLDADTVAALRRRAQAIPAVGASLPGDPAGMTLAKAGAGAFAITRHAIGRDDYKRFADATGRPPARCRERGSVLRVLSPRDWTQPGFEQSGDDAAVCVSWDDAQAYANWLGESNNRKYRLPTAAEARALDYSGGSRQVAEWLLDCTGGNCTQRKTRGNSWRHTQPRPRNPARGYDDLGFRLVREP